MNPGQQTSLPRLPKRHYLLAIVCILLIPVAMAAAGVLFRLIDPELARGHADYVRNFRLLRRVQVGAQLAMAGLVLALWLSACLLVVKSRQRSAAWVLLAAAGPIGLALIFMLEDRATGASDPYRKFIRKLKLYQRIPLEIVLFVAAWSGAFTLVGLGNEWMIRYESLRTGTAIASIVATQNASSGMYAFGNGLEAMYLAVLIYVLWPVLFNLVGHFLGGRPGAAARSSGYSSR